MNDALTLGRHRYPIQSATFRRITDDGSGKPGWEFDIRTGPPAEPSDDAFFSGVRLYAEGDPIPLADVEDLTGVVVHIEEPFDDESGDPYFSLYAHEHCDVSALTLTFHERSGERYRISVTAQAHDIALTPVPLAVDTWIVRLAPKRYGLVETSDAQG